MKFDLILQLPGEIKILADRLNWVLEVGNKNNRTYYHSLDALCDEILDLRIKRGIIEKRVHKNLESLIDVVRDAREATRNDLEQISGLLTNADRRRKKGFYKDDV